MTFRAAPRPSTSRTTRRTPLDGAAIPAGRVRTTWVRWLRGSDAALLTLAVIIGAGAGGGAIVFRWLIKTFTRALSGHADYAGIGHAVNPHVSVLGPYFVLFAPVVAGLLYGPLVHFFAREARGHGVPEVMFAVARRGGRIAPQVAGVKALASALCIGGGGSVGREGPIVQIGAALGSTLGRIARAPEHRLRALVACGAAGGIAATFNAPLAGVFFAMELILRDFTADAFGSVVLSSVTASVIGRAAFGDTSFLPLPPFALHNAVQFGLFAGVGVLAGAAGVVFTRVLYAVEDGCDWLWARSRAPEWARPAVGGLALGAILLALPQMYGVGYPVIGNSVAGRYTVGFLVLLLFAKMAATSLTIGIGGSGGVFAPSLFMGAMLGSAFGQAVHHAFPHTAGPAGAYALIAMGATFSGAARAPITAVVIMFELTGEYTIILPLMAAIVLATALSKVLTPDTIYTLKLRRRGIRLDEPARQSPFTGLTVGDVMSPVDRALAGTTALADAAKQLGASDEGRIVLVDEDGNYQGVATARAVSEAIADGAHDGAAAATILETPPTVRAADSLDAALDALDHAGSTGVAVLDTDERRLVGWLTHGGVLAAYRRAASPEQA